MPILFVLMIKCVKRDVLNISPYHAADVCLFLSLNI